MNSVQTDTPNVKIKEYLDLAVKLHASDIHLVVGKPPIYRVQGILKPAELPPISGEYLQSLIYEMITDRQKNILEQTHELDFSYYCLKDYYFRVNVYREKTYLASTIRIMPSTLRSRVELGLPDIVEDLAMRRSGLVLFVVRAGMGKTTTMTYIVEQINERRQAKVITVEDPIEYVYESKKSLIVQREVGTDTLSFAAGLKYALRQDPDVVVIGEMRDLESISMALTSAETGHIVMATLHAPDAIEAINRIIDVYPGDKQNQIRVQLAENLLAVIGQQLLPHKTLDTRVLATEIIITSLAIRNMIRRNSLAEIRSQMESGREGMYTLEQCLSNLVKKGMITPETAQAHAKFPNLLEF